MTRRKKIICSIAFVILLFACVMAAFLFWKNSGTENLSSKDYQKIRIGNIGEYTTLNLIAKQKNYFQSNMLDVDIKEYQSGPPAVNALLAGEVDIAVAADFVGVNNIFTHPELIILTQASKQRVFSVVARKDLGINNPADLKGRKIGVTKKSAGEFFLGRFLAFNDIRDDDVTVLDLSPSDMIQQLRESTIDAVLTFDPNVYNLQKELGSNGVVWPAQGGQDTSALVYSTDAFIEAHPDAIQHYLQSLLQAENYMSQYPDEAKQFIVDNLGYDPGYVSYSFPNFDYGIGLSQSLVLTMEDQAQWVMDHDLTDVDIMPNYLNSIYFNGLEQVKPDSITIIH